MKKFENCSLIWSHTKSFTLHCKVTFFRNQAGKFLGVQETQHVHQQSTFLHWRLCIYALYKSEPLVSGNKGEWREKVKAVKGKRTKPPAEQKANDGTQNNSISKQPRTKYPYGLSNCKCLERASHEHVDLNRNCTFKFDIWQCLNNYFK